MLKVLKCTKGDEGLNDDPLNIDNSEIDSPLDNTDIDSHVNMTLKQQEIVLQNTA